MTAVSTHVLFSESEMRGGLHFSRLWHGVFLAEAQNPHCTAGFATSIAARASCLVPPHPTTPLFWLLSGPTALLKQPGESKALGLSIRWQLSPPLMVFAYPPPFVWYHLLCTFAVNERPFKTTALRAPPHAQRPTAAVPCTPIALRALFLGVGARSPLLNACV